MAYELSPGQSYALDGLVADGTLSAEQAAVVRARLESADATPAAPAAPGTPAPARGWVLEAAGYLGGTLTFAGAALLMGLSWDDLSRASRAVVLAAVTVVLIGAAVVISGGVRALRAMAGGPSTARRRVVSVLLALAAGTAALAAGTVVEAYGFFVGGATGLALAVAAYLLLPGLPVLLAAGVLSVVTGMAAADDLLDGTPVQTGVTLVVIGACWAVAGVLGGRGAAVVTGAVIGLFGAQLPVTDTRYASWAYLLTLVVAAGCLAAYALDRTVLLLAAGVIGVTLVVSEAVADWTDGAAGGAAAVLTAGIVLLAGSGIAVRLHRRGSPATEPDPRSGH